MKRSKKFIFTSLGGLCLVLGGIGVVLPLIPTTPFILLAAYFFSRGNPKLHRWLIENKVTGKLILDWQEHRVIRPRAKWAATLVIIPLFSYTLYFVKVELWIKVVVALIGLSVLLFIWSCPSHAKK